MQAVPVFVHSTMALFYHVGSRRHIIKQPVLWLKIIQIVSAALIAPLCMMYHKQAQVQVEHPPGSFNITVKYPFHYDNSTAAYTDEDVPPKFSFDPAIEICVQLFVVMAIVTGGAALLMTLLACSVQNSYSQAKKLMIAEIFIAVVMAFLLVISSSLWLYNLLDLRKEIENEIEYIITSTVVTQFCEKSVCTESLPDYTILFVSVGLGFFSFVLWLTETVIVYCRTINQDEVVDTKTLVWSQELPESTPPLVDIEDTAT